jgi:hypothetical protein
MRCIAISVGSPPVPAMILTFLVNEKGPEISPR